MVRPTTNACAECTRRKRICPACKEKTQITLDPPIESGGRPTRTVSSRLTFEEEHHSPQQHTVRAHDGKRRPSPSRTTPSKCARTESPVPRTNTPRPVLQGPLDSWLSARSVQAEVDKAAKLLALAETPTKIASQVQDHARSLACPPARWHPHPPAGMPDCPYARPPTRSPARPPVEIASQVQDHIRELAEKDD